MAGSPRSSSRNLIVALAHSRLLYDYTYNCHCIPFLYTRHDIITLGPSVRRLHCCCSTCVIITVVVPSYKLQDGRSKISKPDSRRCPAYYVIISSRTQTSIMNFLAVKRACAQFFYQSPPPWSSASVGVGVRTRRSLSFPVPRRNAS